MLAWDSLDTRKDARRLLKSVQDPQFLVALVLSEKVSAVLRPVSRSLQKIGSDLVNAMSTISATQSKLHTLLQRYPRTCYGTIPPGFIIVALVSCRVE